MAGPAAEVTRERPSVALEETSDAVDEALEAVCLAASAAFVVVLDSKRTMRRPIERPDRLMTRANDIVDAGLLGAEGEKTKKADRGMRNSAGGAEMGGRGAAGERVRMRMAAVWELGSAKERYRAAWSRMGPEIEKNWIGEARKISKGVVGDCQVLGNDAANQKAELTARAKAQTDASSPVAGLGIPCQLGRLSLSNRLLPL